MNRRDLFVGAEVYHVLLWNWSKGIVVETRVKDNLGYKTPDRYRVRWSAGRTGGSSGPGRRN